MKAYINGCGTDICETNNNATHLVCTFNNVQSSDNHTQIKVFVFDKYGGVAKTSMFSVVVLSIPLLI